MAAFGNFHFYLEKRTAMRLSADVRPSPAHHHKWTAQPGAPFHREANAYDAPPSPGMGTSTTFERSRTGEPLLSLLFRQSPAQTRNPIISPTDGRWYVIGAQRARS